jgi:hypothetical protein
MFVQETAAKWFCERMPNYVALVWNCYSATRCLNLKLLTITPVLKQVLSTVFSCVWYCCVNGNMISVLKYFAVPTRFMKLRHLVSFVLCHVTSPLCLSAYTWSLYLNTGQRTVCEYRSLTTIDLNYSPTRTVLSKPCNSHVLSTRTAETNLIYVCMRLFTAMWMTRIHFLVGTGFLFLLITISVRLESTGVVSCVYFSKRLVH